MNFFRHSDARGLSMGFTSFSLWNFFRINTPSSPSSPLWHWETHRMDIQTPPQCVSHQKLWQKFTRIMDFLYPFGKFIPNSIPILMPCQKLWQSIVKLESVPQAILSQRPAPPPADLLLLMLYCVLNAFLVLVLFLGVKYDYERIAPWKRCDIVKLCRSPDINIPFLCIFPIGVGTCPPGFLETEKWKHLFKLSLSLGGLLVKMRRWWEMAEEIDRSGGNCFLSFSL